MHGHYGGPSSIEAEKKRTKIRRKGEPESKGERTDDIIILLEHCWYRTVRSGNGLRPAFAASVLQFVVPGTAGPSFCSVTYVLREL
mgnify:CR=1 FL=1